MISFKKPKSNHNRENRTRNARYSYLEVAVVHTSKHGVLRQLLHRNAWAGNAKGDPGQEASVVPNFGSSQDGLDLPLVDTPFARLVVRLDEFDWGFRKTEVAVSTAFRRHSAIVGEMSGQFPTQAALGGDEVDYAPDSFHVALFSGLDLRVDGCDDLTLRLFPLWKVFENAEAVHHTAWL